MTKSLNKNTTLYLIFYFVAMFASGIISFVLPLYILEEYDNVLLYGLYISLQYSSLVIVPITLGPIIEKRNKKKTCCLCTTILAVINMVCFFVCKLNLIKIIYVSFIVAVAFGIITTIITLSSNSLLLEVSDKDNLDKIYPFISAIDNISCISQIVGLLVYKAVGINILFIIGSLVFVVASIIGSYIKERNTFKNIEDNEPYRTKLKNGFHYLNSKKALLYTVIFTFLCFVNVGARQITWLPYYRENLENGYFWYFVVIGIFYTGLFHASVLLMFKKVTKKNRLKVFYLCAIIFCISEMFVLFANKYISMTLAYFSGLSYGIINNIRSLSMFEGIDEEIKTRFIGIYNTANNSGVILGTLMTTLFSNKIRLDILNTIPKIIILIFTFYLLICKKEAMRHFND